MIKKRSTLDYEQSPLSLSPSYVARKKTTREKLPCEPGDEKHAKSKASRPQDFARPFCSRGFLSRHDRQTKRKGNQS